MSDSKQRYKYLLGNVLAFLCGSFGTKLISFFMVPLYTNALIPAEYGEMDLVLSVAGFISPFVACGIHEGIMRFSLDKGADRQLVFSIGLRVFVVSSMVFFAITPIVKQIPLISNNAYFLFWYCILNELMTILLCYIRGKDNTKLYALLGFLSALFTAILNLVFMVGFKWGLVGYKASMLISPILVSLVAMVIGNLFPDFSLNRWEWGVAKEILEFSAALIPNAVLWWCINASDRFFVSYICGAAENGIYAVAYKIPTLLSTIASIFMQAWQMSAIREHEDRGGNAFVESVYRYLTFFMCVVTATLMLVNKSVLSVYVAEEYRGAWVYSPVLMMVFFVGALSTFWGSFYIASKNLKLYLGSAVAGALVNIALNFALIYGIGTMGAAIATAASYVVVFLIRSLGINKQVRIRVLNYQLATAAVCLSMALFSAYLSGGLMWVIGVVNIVLYIVLNRKMVISVMKVGLRWLGLKKEGFRE